MAYKKEYQLTDGTWTTVNKVAAEVGCPTTTAAGRLARHKDPEKVFAPWSKRGSDRTKLYTLDCGMIVTAKQVAKKLGCHITLARVRLSQSRDATKVFGVMLSEKEKKKREQALSNYAIKRIHSRGMYDEMLCLVLRQKTT